MGAIRALAVPLLIAIASACVATAASAATRWSAASTAWNTATTWRTGGTSCAAPGGTTGVPAAGDDVVICAHTVTLDVTRTGANAMNTVTLNGASSILTMSAGNDLTTGTLTVNTGGVINIGSNNSQCILTVTGNATNAGTINYSANNIGHQVSITGTLDNSGTITTLGAVGTAKSLTVGGLLTNSGTLNLAGGSVFTVNANGGLTNSGTLRYTTAFNHVISVTGAFTNSSGGTFTSSAVAGTKTLTVSGLITNASGATFRFAGTAAMTVTAQNGITNAGTFDVDTASNVTHTLNVSNGDVANTGTFNLATDANSLVIANFTRNGNQTISGSGATTRFHGLVMNLGTSQANILEVTATAFSFGASGYLTPTNGTFKLSAGVTIAPFDFMPDADTVTGGTQALPNGTTGVVINANAGFWLNNASAVVNVGKNVGATTADYNLTLVGGTLRITAGTMNVGDLDATRIRFSGTTANTFTMEGGNLNVTGRVTVVARTDRSNVTISGGTMTLSTVGNSDANGFGAFVLGTNASSTFNWSAGTIVIEEANNQSIPDYEILTPAAGLSVTGGTLQIGNGSTAAATTIRMCMQNGSSTKAGVWDVVVDATTNTKTALIVTTANCTSTLFAIGDDLTIGTGSTLNANGNSIAIGMGNTSGNWTNNGTFTPGAGTVTFTGTSAAPTIAGTQGTTFNNLTVDKASNDLVINTTATVTGTLTFTTGKIVTTSLPSTTALVIVGTAGTTTGSTGSAPGRWVVGCVRKNFPADGVAPFQAFTYPIGDSSNYTPVTQTFTTANTVGDVTACVVAADHPQVTTPIATTGINAARSVNRYWTLTANSGSTGTPSGTYTLAFTYVAGDNDGSTTPANYVVQRYDGTNWFPTTISGTPTTTAATATGIVAYGAFAIGEPLAGFTPVPGRFVAFETTTPAGAIIGKVFTKVAARSETVAIVAVNSTKTAVDTTFTGAVNVTLITNSLNWASLDANACPTTGTTTPVGGPYALTFAGVDAGRKNLTFTAPTDAYASVRIRVVDQASGVIIGCSPDVFALRPKELLLEGLDTDWQSSGTTRTLHNTGSPGGNVHVASTSTKPFTLRVTPRDEAGSTTSSYNGTPTVKSGPTCVLPTSCSTGALSIDTPWSGTGQRTTTAYYSEAGTFTLEVEDATFAAVDLVDGTPATGTNGYTIPQASPAPREIGRFVPDHFVVATNNTPQFRTFGSTCTSRSFTYIGQRFGYVTGFVPQVTITAQNAANGTTTNYRGVLWNVQAADDVTITSSNNSVGPSLSYVSGGNASITSGNGTGTMTLNSADVFRYDRTTPIAPFNANISLTVSVRDNSDTGGTGTGAEITTTTSATFSDIAFDAGDLFRFGRIRLSNALGSERLNLPIPMTTEYWSGTAFVTNTDDDCTSFVADNFALGSYTGALSNINLPNSKIVVGGAFVDGVGSLRINAPTGAATGSVQICLDLDGSSPTDATCAATTPADQTWLQGPWGVTSYDKDPKSRAAFGVYGGQPRNFIYRRENY